MNRILSKQEFYKLSRKLLLGNILTQWTWEQFENQYRDLIRGYKHDLPANGIVGVRHVRQSFTNKGNSGLMKVDDAIKYGLKTPDKENLLFDEGAIHDNLTIQGEVMAGPRGLYVRYSDLQVHQRTLWHIDQYGVVGLKKFQRPHNMHVLTSDQISGRVPVVKHVEGLRAVGLLKTHMDETSWDKLSDLITCQLENSTSEFNFKYPIIEFACFNISVGQLKWNTLFWEVRTDY